MQPLLVAWHNITLVLRDTTTKTLPGVLLEKEILVDLWYEEGMFWWVQLTCYHWWPEWRFLQAWADELQPKNDRNTLNYATEQLALDSIGRISTERRSCFPMSLTFWSSFHDRNKYGRIRRQSINFFKRRSLCYCDAIYRRVLLFVCGVDHIPSCLFLSRGRRWRQRSENTIFVRFCFTRCHEMLIARNNSLTAALNG